MITGLGLSFIVLVGLSRAEAAADVKYLIPDRGMHSTVPAGKWEEALVSGNGVMGILVFCQPHSERVIFNHEKLYEPLLDTPCPVPDIAGAMPKVRELMLQGKYGEAYAYSYDYAVSKSFPGIQWTDPYHPAFAMTIEHPAAGEPVEYVRTTDFMTGEIAVHWRDRNGAFCRRSFVSRPDNVVVQSIQSQSGGKVDCSITLVNQDSRPKNRRVDAKGGGYNDPEIRIEPGWLSYSCKYARSKRGYEALVRVVVEGGDRQVVDGKLQITGARSVLLLSRVNSLEDFSDSRLARTRKRLMQLDADYKTLLDAHVVQHRAIFNRVSLDLGGGNGRRLSSEELIKAQKDSPDRVINAFLEKMFDMGRYVFISASGQWPPNLMSIWNGDWRPAWSGDFTLDANINLQISAANIGNMLEGLQSYTNLITNIAPDWRINARNYYGCRGVMSGTRTDGRHNLHTHFSPDFPGHFWTAGAQWLTLPMYEYYQVTGDREYIESTLLPLMKDIVLFYEDFLTVTDGNGKYVFVPSYSPENRPSNTRSPAAINATMDIACATEALTSLIAVCEELNVEKDNIPKWKAMLEKMPPYLINADGALKEWAHPDLYDNYNHRHVSHLYPVWPGHEINPEDTPALYEAAKIAATKRGRGNGSAHGLAHMALIGTRLKDADLVYGNLLFILKNNYVLPSLFTYHNPGRIYNSDMLCSLPAVVMEMLVYSRPGIVELLPALSDNLPQGTLSGVLCRGQIRVDKLHWDLKKKEVRVTLTSKTDQEIRLMLRRGIEEIVTYRGKKLRLEDGISAKVKLNKHVPVTLVIKLM